MNVSYFLFLSLGVTRVFPMRNRRIGGSDRLSEPDSARICRRNILALSSVVVLTGLAGADPSALSVFGAEFSGDRGVVVVAVAICVSQVYWYVQRYCHLYEDGLMEHEPITAGDTKKSIKISGNRSMILVRKRADLISNSAAIVMTVLSWCFIVSWIV